MNIVFIVVCKFPHGDASSIRALNLCKIFKQNGHSIHVISDFPSSEENDVSEICTHEYCMDKMPPVGKRSAVAKESINRLTNYIKANNVDMIVMNAKQDRFYRILKLCHENNIKVIVENCEWYHYSNFKLKLLDIRYWRNQWMIKHDFANADGFISISRLLDEHNRAFGKESIRVPTIMDVDAIDSCVSMNSGKIKVIYAGNPGKSKELLLPVFQAFSEYPYLKKRIEFHIYGPNERIVKYNLRNNEQLIRNNRDCIYIHGKVPQLQMPDIMRNANYMLFIRPNRRSSNAGFPTKFGESMAVGTPVITNDTGDISLYLKNKENGYILDDCSFESIRKTFERIIDLSEKDYLRIRQNARKTAEREFDYRKYLSTVETLFSKIHEA